jgi:type I restriction enzyme S subunit
MRAQDTVIHYSIPNFDDFGGAGVEQPEFIESPKVRVVGGEILVSRLNPRKQRVLNTSAHDGLAVCSGEFVVLRAGERVLPRFLYWRMSAEDTRQHFAAGVKSVTRSQQRVDREVVRKLWIDLPTLDGQRRIAHFLDTETARIDGLMAEQERVKRLLAEKLSAKRQALILGSDGMGQPVWEIGRLKSFVWVARGRFTHRPRNDPALYGGDYPFIQTGDIAGAHDGVVRSWSQSLNKIGLAASRLAPAGTLVMAIAANIGDVARLGFDACFPDSVVSLTSRDGLTDEYLLELIRALRADLVGRATLNTQLNINVDRIGEAVVRVPPVIEQEAVLAELRSMTERVADVTREVDLQSQLLCEHRQALITTAVTKGLDLLPGVA